METESSLTQGRERNKNYATPNGYLLQTKIAMLMTVNRAYSPLPSVQTLDAKWSLRERRALKKVRRSL